MNMNLISPKELEDFTGKWSNIVIKDRTFRIKNRKHNNYYYFLDELDIAGVYVIFYNFYNDKKDFYVGTSSNLGRRLRIYGLKDKVVKIRKDKFKYERLTLEARLIYKLNPKRNSPTRPLPIR